MMGGSTSAPLSPQASLPIEREDFATAQEAQPVRWFGGTRLVALQWITDAVNLIAVKASSGGKKGGKAAKANPQYDYYGTVAGIIGIGPLDSLSKILLSNSDLFVGPVGAGGDYTDLTGSIDSRFFASGGYARIYWGTETQTADPALAGHPGYRGYAYLILHNFLFGRMVTTAPDIQAIATRRIATIGPGNTDDNLTGERAEQRDGQVNPLDCTFELISRPWGLHFPVGSMEDTFVNNAFFLDDSGVLSATCYCSPLLEGFTPARGALQDLLDLCDGAMRWTVAGGLDCVRKLWGSDPGDVPTFDARHFVDGSPPQLDAQGLAAVPTEVDVSFTNRDKLFKRDMMTTPNLWAQQLRPDANRLQLNREMVTRAGQAAIIGANALAQTDQPRPTVTMQLRRALVLTADGQAFLPGDKIKVNLNPEPGGAPTANVVFVTEVSYGRTGPVTVKGEVDTLLGAVPYSPDIPAPPGGSETADEIAYALGVPLPSPAYGTDPAFAVLAARPAANLIGAVLFFDTDSGGAFPELGVLTGFAVRCSLVADINNAVTTVRLTLLDGLTGPDAGIAGATPDNDLAAARGDLVLILATPVAGTGGALNNGVASSAGAWKLEFCFINTRVAVSGATFDYTVIRGRQGLAARSWTAASAPQAWIVRATDLAVWNDPSLASLVTSGNPGYVKLQSFSAFAVADPSTLPLLQFKMKP